MDTSFYGNQNIQKELNAKYQIASKELQNLYKRSVMIEPLLHILEDIYSKEDDGSAIAPLNLSINQIKVLNADIKTCLLNVKERKSGPFQRIVKSKSENFDALETKWDKLVKDLEVSLFTAEQAAKENSERKKLNKAKPNQYSGYSQDTYNNGGQQNTPKYTLTDNNNYYSAENYNNNYNYNNNAINAYNNNSYQEPANYNNYNNDQNNSNYDNANLSNQFSYLNVNDDNNDNSKSQISQDNIKNQNQNQDQSNYGNYNNSMDYYNNQNSNSQIMNMPQQNYQQPQDNYNYPQDQMNNNQYYNNYTSPSQQYYYGTLSKNDQPQQNMNNYNPNTSYQDMNNYQNNNNYNNQNQQQNSMNYQNQMPTQMQQLLQQQQQLQQQQLQQQQLQQKQIQQQMENESLINQKGLIPPTPYYAISQFTPRQPDELAIEQGDEVIIVQTFDDGWAFGRNSRTRMVGVLPMTFLSYSNYGNNYQYNNELPDRQSSRRL